MTTKNAPTIAELTTDFHSLLQERLRLSIRKTLIDILEEEVTAFLQAGKYQRSAERTDHCNGHYTRHPSQVSRIQISALHQAQDGECAVPNPEETP